MMVRVVKGNTKLPATTYILNMGPANDCPSLKLGLCQAGKNCYARRSEYLYKRVLPARLYEQKVWQALSAMEIASQLLLASKQSRKYPMKGFRFSEAGDFYSQSDVEKMAELCSILKKQGVKCYGYTARTDLDLTSLIKVAKVNVSNDLNNWNTKGANRFLMVRELSKGLACKSDCSICSLCFKVTNKTIQIKRH